MSDKKGYASNKEVRWCPGCGDHAILTTLQRTLPELGVDKDNIAIISGIGCSSRLPYYMDVNGFHTLHGRAFPIATGLNVTRPDLSVWVVTGDGDGLSIGLSHLIHLCRRNVNVNIIMFNNRIYGLTKGQYSPSSKEGQISRTSTSGVKETPLEPINVAINAGATFVARTMDVDLAHLKSTLKQAAEHKGCSFIEVLQNCNVYNDGVYKSFSDKKARKGAMTYLKDGEQIKFGEDEHKGIKFNMDRFSLEETREQSEAITHNINGSKEIALMLADMHYPKLPVALGVFLQKSKPTYTDTLDLNNASEPALDNKVFSKAIKTAETWEI